MTEFLQQTFNGLSIGSVYVLVGVGLTLVFGIWLALGLLLYFSYGVRNSRLARRAKAQGRLAA